VFRLSYRWHDGPLRITFHAALKAYTTTIQYTDGTNTTLDRRERPVLVFDVVQPGGCKWVPIALINGVLDHNSSDDRASAWSARSGTDASAVRSGAAGGERTRPGTVGAFTNTPTYTLVQPILHK
jgi:hypothetical protein